MTSEGVLELYESSIPENDLKGEGEEEEEDQEEEEGEGPNETLEDIFNACKDYVESKDWEPEDAHVGRLNSAQSKVLVMKRMVCTCEVPDNLANKMFKEPPNNIEKYIVRKRQEGGRCSYVRFKTYMGLLCVNAKTWPNELRLLPNEVRRLRFGLESAKRIRHDVMEFWTQNETCHFRTSGYIEDDLVYRMEFARRKGLVYEVGLFACNTPSPQADLKFTIAVREWLKAEKRFAYCKGDEPRSGGEERDGAIVGAFDIEAAESILSYLDRAYVEIMPLPIDW